MSRSQTLGPHPSDDAESARSAGPAVSRGYSSGCPTSARSWKRIWTPVFSSLGVAASQATIQIGTVTGVDTAGSRPREPRGGA